LLTSDWQAEISNLDSCEVALGELLEAATAHKPDAIIHCGDLKEHYSPIAVQVPKFWVKAILSITRDWRFIVLLGNHDRISQSRESKNWLDILRVAGAETVSLPRWKDIGDGHVAFLPYTSDKPLERKWARDLAAADYPSPRILIYHTEVKEAMVSYGGGNGVIDLVGLHTTYYDGCFGGHIHQHMEIGEGCYYVGSPFCQDWGEANQTKGNLLVDVTA
jgi:DNA repair exonuclease SbcCD nuclease subunit